MKPEIQSALMQNKFPDEAYWFLFGNETCTVCNPVKSKLEKASNEMRQKINFCYIDSMEDQLLTASLSIFTIPVVIFSFQGKEYHRWVRNFSITEIIKVTNRIMDLYNTDKG